LIIGRKVVSDLEPCGQDPDQRLSTRKDQYSPAVGRKIDGFAAKDFVTQARVNGTFNALTCSSARSP
jgi:hypothetical protein